MNSPRTLSLWLCILRIAASNYDHSGHKTPTTGRWSSLRLSLSLTGRTPHFTGEKLHHHCRSEGRKTVPLLSFLIRHKSKDGVSSNLVFDLGIQKNFDGYVPAQQHQITQRQPVVVEPDAADSLRAAGLDPAEDVDIVILNHVPCCFKYGGQIQLSQTKVG